MDRKASQVFIVDDAPSDGDTIVWDATLRQWKPGAGGGGAPNTLVDATTGEPGLRVDNGIIQILAGFDFHSHGDLFNVGPTVNGGAQPIWGDPTSALWHDKGNFGFFYGGPFDVEAFEFWMAYGADPGLTMDMSPTANTLNLFLKAGQTGVTDAVVLWDEDHNKTFTIGDATVDGGTDGPNATVWWSPDRNTHIDMYALNGNAEMDMVTDDGGILQFFAATGFTQFLIQPGTTQGSQSTLLVKNIAGAKVIEATADTKIGFYNHAPVARQTGVAVTAAGIHAALVATGLITA